MCALEIGLTLVGCSLLLPILLLSMLLGSSLGVTVCLLGMHGLLTKLLVVLGLLLLLVQLLLVRRRLICRGVVLGGLHGLIVSDVECWWHDGRGIL